LALLEISVLPVGTDGPSISSIVTRACREAKEAGVKFQVTPTATVMEGELSALMRVAENMHKAVLQAGSPRVVTSINIDERRDKPLSMEESVEAVRVKV
jgi:uncharacterized protein (TIGR00106 family)